MQSIYDVVSDADIFDAVWWLDQTIAMCAIEDADIVERIPEEYTAHRKLDGNIIMVHGELPVSAEVELDENDMIVGWGIWVKGVQVEMED